VKEAHPIATTDLASDGGAARVLQYRKRREVGYLTKSEVKPDPETAVT
jgi:hypothetical protein